MKLTKFEEEMIKTISKHTTGSQPEVMRIWLLCKKSYDKTIFCINKSQQLAVLPDDLCE